MWTHYADGHRGMVIGVEVPKQIDRVEIVKIEYDNQAQSFTPPINDASLLKALSHKPKESHYEKEVRLISFDESKEFVEEIEIVDVTFGLRTPKSDKQDVLKMLNGRLPNYWEICVKPKTYLLNRGELAYG